MIPFELFVKTLGEHAKLYTKEQLQELHIDVRRLAEVLIQVRQAKRAEYNPQPGLDTPGTDHMIKETVTMRPDHDHTNDQRVSNK